MKNIKLRTVLILSFSAGIVGSILAHLLVKDQNSIELLVVNAIAVALVMAVFFLLYYRFSKKQA